MRVWLPPLFVLFTISCAIGPTPERSGFNYPQAGLRFSPRVHVTSDTVRGTVATTGEARYVLLFPRTTSHIESPNVRLLTTGIVGEWDEDARPLFDEIGIVLYGAEPQNTFELVEKRDIELPWPGLVNKTGELRIFRMMEIGREEIQYTFTVLVHHFGNTIEFCWRDSGGNPPDEEKMEVFFYWTRGLRFGQPESGGG